MKRFRLADLNLAKVSDVNDKSKQQSEEVNE